MSSLKLESRASGCSSRVATKVPEPWCEATRPRAASSSSAFLTVVRETVELLGKEPLRRQRVAVLELAVGDRRRHPLDELQVERGGEPGLELQAIPVEPWRAVAAGGGTLESDRAHRVRHPGRTTFSIGRSPSRPLTAAEKWYLLVLRLACKWYYKQ